MADALRAAGAARQVPHRLQRVPVHHVPDRDGDGHRAGDLVHPRPLADQPAARMEERGSSVREDTPERHQKTKAGTPTMGGIGILVAILASTLLWANLRNRYVWVLVLVTAGFGLIGFKDDWKKLKTRRGISAREKFGAQILLVLVLTGWLYVWPPDGFTTSVVIP